VARSRERARVRCHPRQVSLMESSTCGISVPGESRRRVLRGFEGILPCVRVSAHVQIRQYCDVMTLCEKNDC
jgi:hypothetical protein